MDRCARRSIGKSTLLLSYEHLKSSSNILGPPFPYPLARQASTFRWPLRTPYPASSFSHPHRQTVILVVAFDAGTFPVPRWSSAQQENPTQARRRETNPFPSPFKLGPPGRSKASPASPPAIVPQSSIATPTGPEEAVSANVVDQIAFTKSVQAENGIRNIAINALCVCVNAR